MSGPRRKWWLAGAGVLLVGGAYALGAVAHGGNGRMGTMEMWDDASHTIGVSYYVWGMEALVAHYKEETERLKTSWMFVERAYCLCERDSNPDSEVLREPPVPHAAVP